MPSASQVEDIDRIARQISDSAEPNEFLAARAAKALGFSPPFTPCLSDPEAARRLVEGTEQGGRVIAVEQLTRGSAHAWIATLDDAAGQLFKPGVFGLARTEAMAIIVAALRRASYAKSRAAAASR